MFIKKIDKIIKNGEEYNISLPKKKIAVPFDGNTVVDKIYLNTDLSVDEVNSILSKLTLIPDSEGIYSVFIDNEQTIGITLIYLDGQSTILTGGPTGEFPIFVSNEEMSEAIGAGFVGWKPELTQNYIEIGSASSSPDELSQATETPISIIGQQNDLLVDLIYTMGSTENNNYYLMLSESQWVEITDKEPFKYSYSTGEMTLDEKNVKFIELINNNPVLFAKYGFSLISASSEGFVIYAIEKPTEDVYVVYNIVRV